MADHDQRAMAERLARARLSRRGFLSASALGATSAFLAACTPSGASPSASARPSASAAGSPAGSAAASAVPSASYATEGSLFMYNWSEYVDPENIEEFKRRYDIGTFTYDIFDSNEQMLTKLQGGATGLYDIGAPTAEFIKILVDEGFIEEIDFSRIPNARYINPQFQNFYDPNGPDAKYNAYHLPKDWGTTGIGVRTKLVSEEVNTWAKFFELAPKYSKKIVLVDSPGDVFTAPLKALGYSLNSVDPQELGEARTMLMDLAPHVLALDSNDYADKLATEEAVLGLVWTGGVVDLREEEETADTEYVVPEDGTLYWMDTWVVFADAPHPEAAYAFLNFIHEPEIQAKETETNLYATANDEAKKLVDPELLADPAVFVPDAAFDRLEGANDVSSDPLRVEIWEEFKSKIGG